MLRNQHQAKRVPARGDSPFPIIAVSSAPMALDNQTSSVDPRVTGLRSRLLAKGISSQGDGSPVLRRFSRDISIPRLDPNLKPGVTSSRETPRSIERVGAVIDRDPVRVTHEELPDGSVVLLLDR
jgi:hypothetical protein